MPLIGSLEGVMARTPRDLSGRTVAITGGARGIGRAIAQACVRAQMKVAIGDLDLVAAHRTAAELGHGTIAIELDVSNRASMRHFLDIVEERLGPLDVLVNNAGIMHLGSLEDEDDASTRRQVDINVHGVMHGMKEALPRMKARRRGHVVNIASTAGRGGFAGAATYSGTKHFVVGASEAVRFELRGSGVDISCVLPVVVRTELAAGTSDARFVARLEPEDVADAVMRTLRRAALRGLRAALHERDDDLRRRAAASRARGDGARAEGRPRLSWTSTPPHAASTSCARRAPSPGCTRCSPRPSATDARRYWSAW